MSPSGSSEPQDRKIMKTRSQARIGAKLERNLWSYAAAAGAAGVGMLAMAPGAEAKVVYTPVDQKITPSIALDLNADGVIDFNLTHFGSASVGGSLRVSWLAVCHDKYIGFSHQCVSSTNDPNAANLVRVVPTGAADLAAGANIGPGPQWGGQGQLVFMANRVWYSAYWNTKQIWQAPWANEGKGVTNRYLGFKFKIGNDYHYGWARVTLTTTADSGFSATLTGYAYETIPGKAIVAGATSGAEEVGAVNAGPATDASTPLLGMFALGAQGLSLWRRDESQGGL
jgi:hypothetical protein